MSTTTNLQHGFKSPPTAENTRAIPGAVFNFLAMGHETQNGHALIRILVNKGAEPPAHTHAREDESYYVLTGTVRYTIGDDVYVVNANEYIFLPRNVHHKFEILSDEAELLMWLNPVGLDQWFWDNSSPAPDGNPLPIQQGPPPSHVIEHFVSSLREYGVEMM